MPITRTAWIDDDGTGKTGTVINNAEKQLLYDQIDAALLTANNAPWKGHGDYSGAGYGQMTSYQFTGLAVEHTVEVFLTVARTGADGLGLSLGVYDPATGGGELLSLHSFSGGSGDPAGARGHFHVLIRSNPSNGGELGVVATGGYGVHAGPQTTAGTVSLQRWASGLVSHFTLPWYLFLACGGNSAGGHLWWNIQGRVLK